MQWWQWLLVIAGGFILALLVVALAVYLFVKSKLRQLKGAINNFVNARGGTVLPQTVTLLPPTDPAPSPETAARISEAKALGFEVGGPFLLEENPGVVLHTLAHAEHEVVGTFTSAPGIQGMDVVTLYADGTALTHTTLPAQGFDQPPSRDMTRSNATTLGELLKQHLRDRPNRDRRRVSLDEVPGEIKRAVEEEFLWRASRGGLTDEEIARHFEIRARNPATAPKSEEERQRGPGLIREQVQKQVTGYLFGKAREQYQKETTLPVHEWEKVEDNLVFVADQILPEYLEVFVRADSDSSALPELQRGRLRQTFAEVNELLPDERKLRKLDQVLLKGALAEVVVDVYVLPEHLDDMDLKEDEN